MEKAKLIRKFDRQAKGYARRRAQQSSNRWRHRIMSHARGRTLEAAVGAGMNFPYFPPNVEYVGVDFSPAMLAEAKQGAADYNVQAEFVLGDIEAIEWPDRSFDTIVSSGSLCSYSDPLAVLDRFRQWCKEDGRILLLEHGVCSVPAIAKIQDWLDPLAFRVIGCHQNRDILELVRTSGLVVERYERALLGYLYLIWAKPL